jgi:lipopolysaccharide export system protein LptA
MSFVSYLYAADENIKKRTKAEVTEPIQIISDRLDVYSDKMIVVFSGNAVARQGDRTIKSDKILLYYKKKPTDEKEGGSLKITSGDLERIEASGHVTIRQSERIVKGEEAIFYQDEQKIIITGNAVMTEGKNVIHGDKIVVLLRENRGFVESVEDKRVTATIYPGEKGEKKK